MRNLVSVILPVATRLLAGKKNVGAGVGRMAKGALLRIAIAAAAAAGAYFVGGAELAEQVFGLLAAEQEPQPL